MKDFRGTGVAMVTPFKADLSIDFPALEKLTNHLIDGGIDYLVVQGTTGESVTLTATEKQDVLDCIAGVNAGRLPIVYGHGGNNTRALIEGFEGLKLDHVDAILSTSPYYNKPTQAGILAHYKALADATPKPIILYNVPGRTASNLTAATTLELAGHKNIIAVKEASGDLGQVATIIHDRPSKFIVLSGDDPLIMPHMSLGGDGIISVIANAFPKEFSDIVSNCMIGEYSKARHCFYTLRQCIDLLFSEGNPAGVKGALQILGIMENHVRLPLVPASKELMSKLEKNIKKIQANAIT